jgi:hypothetical protein
VIFGEFTMSLFSFKFLKSAQAIVVPQVPTPSPQASRARPLRVLCVRDNPGNGPTGGHAGRLVISGRMADVCAELDRMVQAQTLKQMPSPSQRTLQRRLQLH